MTNKNFCGNLEVFKNDTKINTTTALVSKMLAYMERTISENYYLFDSRTQELVAEYFINTQKDLGILKSYGTHKKGVEFCEKGIDHTDVVARAKGRVEKINDYVYGLKENKKCEY